MEHPVNSALVHVQRTLYTASVSSRGAFTGSPWRVVHVSWPLESPTKQTSRPPNKIEPTNQRNMSPTSKSGGHDRRGFENLLRVFLVMVPVSLIVMIFYCWQIGLALCMCFGVAFITTESVSARPDNNPHTFKKWERSQRERRPVLLCLGDSLTHGNVSASITPEIPLKLCSFLGLPTPDYGKTFADPVWVVNAGQNMITTHTILHERLHSSMGVFPDYIMLLIGTNDVRAMYKESWCKQVMSVNELPEKPTIQVFNRNLTSIIKFIRQASPKVEIGLCTLPPMGENLKSRANQLVRQANDIIEQVGFNAGEGVSIIPVFAQLETVIEKKKRRFSWPIDLWLFASMCQLPLYHMLGGIVSLNLLSKFFGFCVMSDGIHLNESGRDVVVDLVVDWLASRNVAKAIAVKKM